MLLSSLSLYWLLLPVTSTPSCSSKQLLLSRAAMVVFLTLCQADTSCVTRRHSPFGFAWSISPSTVWVRQTQTADASLPFPEQSHSTGNSSLLHMCSLWQIWSSMAHTSPAQQANSPAHCFVLLSLQQELPQRLQANVPSK